MSSLESLLQSHADYCLQQIESLSRALKRYPPGSLHLYVNKNSVQFKILYPGKKPEFLPRRDSARRKTMVKKALCEARLKDRSAELDACKACLNLLARHPHAEDKLLAHPQITALLSEDTSEADLQAWLDEPYPKNTRYPEHLIVPTAAGFPVRSKSEAMIVSLLLDLKIPFRYEQEYILNEITMSPDFTLLHPRTRKTCILEHFGLMDNPDYANQAADKLRIYIANGFQPQESLLFFFEYSGKPLDINYARAELERWRN